MIGISRTFRRHTPSQVTVSYRIIPINPHHMELDLKGHQERPGRSQKTTTVRLPSDDPDPSRAKDPTWSRNCHNGKGAPLSRSPLDNAWRAGGCMLEVANLTWTRNNISAVEEAISISRDKKNNLLHYNCGWLSLFVANRGNLLLVPIVVMVDRSTKYPKGLVQRFNAAYSVSAAGLPIGSPMLSAARWKCCGCAKIMTRQSKQTASRARGIHISWKHQHDLA